MDKTQLLDDIKNGLVAGIINEDDLRVLIRPSETIQQPIPADPDNNRLDVENVPEDSREHILTEKLSAVDLMFYVAGIVLFAAVMSLIIQSWGSGRHLVQIAESAGVGLLLWGLSYYLVKSPLRSDLRKGLINALNVTGSLLVIVGGFIAAGELVNGFDKPNYYAYAATLVILSALHFGMDRLVRRYLLLLLGVLLGVVAFPMLMTGILQSQHVSIDIWAGIGIVTGLLLGYTTRVVARFYPERPGIAKVFDPLAATIVLGSMYTASYGDYDVLWTVVLIGSILGLFYMSIISQNKQLLGNASFFLIVTVITIAFKYFSGFGASVSLIIAAAGLLGSAAVAAGINKKYFVKNNVVSKNP